MYARLAFIGLAMIAGCNARFDFDVPIEASEAGPSDCSDKCAQWSQQCAPDWKVCVECNQDSDCSIDPSRTRCSMDHRCVQCKTNVDCPSGGLCVATNYECRQACASSTSDDVCESDNQRCGLLGVCVECVRDQECSSSSRGSRCLDCGYCAACRFNSDCSGATPICDPLLHRCVECSDGRNCASGCCDQSTHQCY